MRKSCSIDHLHSAQVMFCGLPTTYILQKSCSMDNLHCASHVSCVINWVIVWHLVPWEWMKWHLVPWEWKNDILRRVDILCHENEWHLVLSWQCKSAHKKKKHCAGRVTPFPTLTKKNGATSPLACDLLLPDFSVSFFCVVKQKQEKWRRAGWNRSLHQLGKRSHLVPATVKLLCHAYDIVCLWYRVHMISCAYDIVCLWYRVHMISCAYDIVCLWYRVLMISCAEAVMPVFTIIPYTGKR